MAVMSFCKPQLRKPRVKGRLLTDSIAEGQLCPGAPGRPGGHSEQHVRRIGTSLSGGKHLNLTMLHFVPAESNVCSTRLQPVSSDAAIAVPHWGLEKGRGQETTYTPSFQVEVSQRPAVREEQFVREEALDSWAPGFEIALFCSVLKDLIPDQVYQWRG